MFGFWAVVCLISWIVDFSSFQILFFLHSCVLHFRCACDGGLWNATVSCIRRRYVIVDCNGSFWESNVACHVVAGALWFASLRNVTVYCVMRGYLNPFMCCMMMLVTSMSILLHMWPLFLVRSPVSCTVVCVVCGIWVIAGNLFNCPEDWFLSDSLC